jgi:hypothetical protein
MASRKIVACPGAPAHTLVAVRFRLAVASSALVLVASAQAQAGYPTCDKRPTPADIEAAKGLHKAAEQYNAKALYERAIESWRDAYNFDCSAHRLLINIGNAYEKLGKTREAIDAFDTYVSRVGPAADQTIVEKVENLRKLLGDQAKPPLPPTGTGGGGPVHDPGRGNGGGGPLPPSPPPEPPDTGGGPGPAPWILVGGGGLLAVVGAILLPVGLGKVGEADDICGGFRDPCGDPDGLGGPEKSTVSLSEQQRAADLGNQGRTMVGAGGALVGLGVAAAAGGVLWYALAPTESTPAPPQTAFRLAPAAGPHAAGLSVSGLF